jgi:polyribonucleotide nucleotidyltransferase
MIERGLVITGGDAELLSNALSEVKTKVYEESEAQLDDAQALDALVSGFRSAESDGNEKEGRHTYFSPLSKCLVLGTIIERKSRADGRAAERY